VHVRVPTCASSPSGYLMRVQSGAIRCNQDAIQELGQVPDEGRARSRQRSLVGIMRLNSGNHEQPSSAVIKSGHHQRSSSAAISGHQWPSVAVDILADQAPTTVPQGQSRVDAVACLCGHADAVACHRGHRRNRALSPLGTLHHLREGV